MFVKIVIKSHRVSGIAEGMLVDDNPSQARGGDDRIRWEFGFLGINIYRAEKQPAREPRCHD
jgi:hypothetical protein